MPRRPSSDPRKMATMILSFWCEPCGHRVTEPHCRFCGTDTQPLDIPLMDTEFIDAVPEACQITGEKIVNVFVLGLTKRGRAICAPNGFRDFGVGSGDLYQRDELGRWIKMHQVVNQIL